MRNVVALGAAIILVGSVGIAGAQERLPQNQSGLGVGTGVGDISGSSSRGNTFDRGAFLERLSQPETIFGRVIAIDVPAGKLLLEGGGSSHDESRVGSGAMNYRTVYIDRDSNTEQLRQLQAGDDLSLQVVEETTAAQPFGTGRKMIREFWVVRENEKLAGFGGLGQRPDPATERGIVTNSGGVTGAPVGAVLPGEIHEGVVQTSVGEFTGQAPCWNCEPQPGWGYNTVTPEEKKQNKSDYGSDVAKPNTMKGYAGK